MLMKKEFIYPSRGPGRPQILLIGNGLEHKSGQKEWKELLEMLTVEDAVPITEKQKDCIPFPLLYQLLATHAPAPAHLTASEIKEEEDRLAAAMGKLKHESNVLLDRLPAINADHILTTNYSYCLEKAFYPGLDFTKPVVRNRKRFRLAQKRGSGGALVEREYRLHSGYIARSVGVDTGLWHIHGECSVPKGIVLSHDRYGRLLQRIERICSRQRYPGDSAVVEQKTFTSWPELFLYGDVYVLGLGLDANEFDLWWLLRRKQRERYADGKVYFYERRPKGGFKENKHLLMLANGVCLCDAGCGEEVDFDTFYIAALEDIKRRIDDSRK